MIYILVVGGESAGRLHKVDGDPPETISIPHVTQKMLVSFETQTPKSLEVNWMQYTLRRLASRYENGHERAWLYYAPIGWSDGAAIDELFKNYVKVLPL